MSNFDFKKYLAEGKLHEEEQVNPQIDALQQALGVKVVPSDSNPERLIIYPDSAPDREKYYDSRSAQRISILAKDGKYYLLSAFGYGRSISSIAVVVGAAPQSTGFAGFKAIDVSMKKPEVNTTLLKMYVKYMQQGLKDESDDQRNFYKGWSNPD